jgi:hypothetical protein
LRIVIPVRRHGAGEELLLAFSEESEAFTGEAMVLADLELATRFFADINGTGLAYIRWDKHEPRVSPRTLPDRKTDGPVRT